MHPYTREEQNRVLALGEQSTMQEEAPVSVAYDKILCSSAGELDLSSDALVDQRSRFKATTSALA